MTLPQLLRLRARQNPGHPLYIFLFEGEVEAGRLTYADLDRQAGAVAAALRQTAAPGDRALLLFPPGLDFIVAFLGCLYTGVVAVPAYPPRPRRDRQRFESIVRDCEPRAVLTTAALRAATASLAGPSWIATDELATSDADGDDLPRIEPSWPAFLQYTSGSTGSPKGVIVSHANLMHNERMIQAAFRQDESSVVVGWLPLYHDMGLIGNILQPLFCGGRCILMSPLAFLQRPRRWLEAISRFRATTSGGPNFAYDLCVRRIRPEERRDLDLSSWRLAFNGAEPVRHGTMERFAEAFAPCGFRYDAFYPCYGLAEATLFVTGGTSGEPPRVRSVEAQALEGHEVVPAALTDESARQVVSCGRPWAGQRVVIVDPQTRAACPPGHVGEVWLSGPSVAHGYWERPEETARDFQAALVDTGDGPFLRTGDLGFLLEGELFITGRLKDLIILRGRNHYPQDLELAAEQAHLALRPGCSAAFSVESGGEERLVLVCEVEQRADARVEDIAAAVRRRLAEEHEIRVDEFVLARTGTIPKTSSGKIRRRACRDLYQAGEQSWVGRSALDQAAGEGPESTAPLLAAPGDTAPEGEPPFEAFLRRTVARLARTGPEQIDADQPLMACGLDSLAAAELQAIVEDEMGVALPMSGLLGGMSLRETARRLAQQGPPPLPQPASDGPVLSWGQRALWTLYRLAPQSAAYHLAGAARVLAGPGPEGLRRVLQLLGDRHDALRTTYAEGGHGPIPCIAERSDLAFSCQDASGWNGEELERRIREEAFRPFDLERGPVFRVALFAGADGGDILVVAAHHIATDFASFGVLVQELGSAIAGEALPPPPLQATDAVRWQEAYLAWHRESLWEWWREHLAGAPALDLPTDRPRPPVQSFRGGARAMHLATVLPAALAGRCGATPFMVLLAGFAVLLARFSNQEDFLVGTPTSGRSLPGLGGRLMRTVGYLVHPIALRVNLAGEPSTVDLVTRVRTAVLEAFAHLGFPFALLVERLQAKRDAGRPPLMQAMLVLQRASVPELEALHAFALGLGGARLRLGGLELESLPLEHVGAPLDLTMTAAELNGRLAVSLGYNADLFDPVTAERLLGRFANLLAAMVASPERSVWELDLLSEAERRQVLETWSRGEPLLGSGDLGLHELFEAQALAVPDATALVRGEERVSYRELDRRAENLARRLRRLGVGPEVRVAVFAERTPDMVAALLAVLKAGGAYLPLDPAYPQERLSFLLVDGQVTVVVAQPSIARLLPAYGGAVVWLDGGQEEPVGRPPRGLWHAEQLAYVIYTSGSTGTPKGVGIRHASVVARLVWAMATYGEQLAGVLAATSICFDLSVFELFAPLAWGGTVILARDALALADLPAAGEVRLVNTVPSAIAELVCVGAVPPSVRTVNLAGEPLRRELVARLYELPWIEAVHDLYGPSEDTTYSTAALAGRNAAGEPAIGRPLPGSRAFVLDRRQQPVPAAVVGELWLGGAGLARGYLGRPELTAERFQPDPFGAEPGGRLYRTGDLARWRPDGELEFLGRLDHQVKVRGHRIELGEVEAILRGHPGVKEAAVVVRDDLPGGRGLVACVAPATEVDAAGLRSWLRTKLPAPLMPEVFQLLEALPRTPNGKVDRRALAAALPAVLAADVAGIAGIGAAPRTPVEEVLAGIWADLLGVEQIRLHDDFFELGGHSLLAARLVARLRAPLGVELPLSTLFDNPTLAGFAAAVESVRGGGPMLASPPLVSAGRERDLPLSFAQERLWFLDRLAPQSATYSIPAALRLRGALCVPALAAALSEIRRRHEVLRTVFADRGGTPVQRIERPADLPLPCIDLSGYPASAAVALALAEREARRPFDLARGPLLRTALLRLAVGDHLLLLNLHHIVFDGGSADVFLRELEALYSAFAAGEPSPLPRLAVQYADFAVWQRAWLAEGLLAVQLGYWRDRLAGAPPALALPTDRPRPAVQTFRGAEEPVVLPAALTAVLRRAARRHGSTLFAAVLAGFSALLSRASGQRDLVIGTAVANRSRSELEFLIGLFVNTLPLRVELGDDGLTVGGLLDRLRGLTLEAYAHQEVPFERLVEELQPVRDLSRSPLFDVLLVFRDGAAGTARLPRLETELVPLHSGTAKFDLTLSVAGMEDGLAGGLELNTDLFDRVTVRRMVGHLAALLAGIAADDGLVADLPLLGEAERHQLVVEWNATAAPYPRPTGLHELFEARAVGDPGATALICGGEEHTYGELDRRADRLAHRLRLQGVGPEVLVAVLAGRNADMVTALLAVLKAGGAYVPLDPAYPRERIALLLADSGAPVLLTESSLAASLPSYTGEVVLLDGSAVESDLGPSRRTCCHPEQLACVIYTSGSTGTPKGVGIRHGSVAARIAWALSAYPPDRLRGVLAATSITFDLSVFEIFVPLAAGGAVVLAQDALALPALPAAARVTLVNTVPSAMAELAQAGALPPSVHTVNLAGEPLRRELAEQVYTRSGVEALYNLYGPSEDTTYSTAALVPRGAAGEPTIGRPLPNTRVYVLDEELRPVPLGVPGALWIGGNGLARGYLGHPALTAERFRPDPFAGAAGGRLYDTGDLARWRPNGELGLLGRSDQQVKVRGYRIELGEIEAALARHAGIHEAAVLAVDDPLRGRGLVAFVAGPAVPPARELRAFLGEILPAYMVPAGFVAMASLPLTANGKVDRRALAARCVAQPEMAGQEAPRGPMEEVIAGLWAEALGLDRVGAQDHFFALGGHSLLASRLVSQMREIFQADLTLRHFFEAPTVAGLAATLREVLDGADGLAPLLEPVPRGPALPLSSAQRRLWLLDRLSPGSPAYNIPVVLHCAGRLEVAVLAAALDRLRSRHEALRTTFAESAGGPVQRISPAAALPLPQVDLAALGPSRAAAEAERLATVEARRPFDLAAGPLLRTLLLRLGCEDHRLSLTVHHTVADGWSLGVLLRDLAAFYGEAATGLPARLPALPIQPADVAVLEQQRLADERVAAGILWWERQLAGAPLLQLPTDRPRPALRSLRGRTSVLDLPSDLVAAVSALARRERVTPFMVLLSTFQALLFRTTGEEDLAIGSAVAQRGRAELEPLVGLLLETVVLRTVVAGDRTFRELLGEARRTVLDAFRHADVPFERVVERLRPERGLGHNPLFEVSFALQPDVPDHLDLPGLVVEAQGSDTGTARFEIGLFVREASAQLTAALEHSADLFDAPTAERMLRHFVCLLSNGVAAPEARLAAMRLLGEAERFQLLAEWNDVPAEPASSGLCLHEVFAAQAARTPDALAVVCEEESLTYQELRDRAEQLAGHLLACSAGPGARVGLWAGRSAGTIPGILATLAAGAAYVPLDPAHPAERLAHMVRDGGLAALLVPESTTEALPDFGLERISLAGSRAAAGAAPSLPRVFPQSPAYVLYTSGSTGRPKGVCCDHAGVLNLLRDMELRQPVRPGAACTQFASFSFDVSVYEIFSALLAGGRLEIVPDRVRADGLALAGWLAERAVESAFVPAPLLGDLARALERVRVPLRRLLVGVEPIPEPLLGALAGRIPELRIFNGYGPTEATVYVTLHEVGSRPVRDRPAPVGRPVRGNRVYLLDRGLEPVPIGVPGELYAAGAGLALGYLGKPELTAERFLPDPFDAAAGARMYRTGDLARRLPDGDVEILGRLDFQVKIRGVRVEPGEIEAALRTHPAVAEAVVAAREDAAGGRRLAAYVVPAAGAPERELTASELRRYLAERLPEVMIPAAFVTLPALPRTRNGKIDRLALPAPGVERPPLEIAYVAPRTPDERAIGAVWQEVLGQERIGIHDNFFELGGNSLLLVEVEGRLREALGRELPITEMYRNPTIHGLARALAARECPAPPPRAAVAPAAGGVVDRQRQHLEEMKRRRAQRRAER